MKIKEKLEKIQHFKNVFKNNKKLRNTLVFTILLGFIFTLGYSLSVFTQNKKNQLININVNGLVFNMTTNSGQSDDRVLELKANQIEEFSIKITNYNKVDTKYEVIYDICTDVNCTSFVDDNKNIAVTWNSNGEDLSGLLKKGTDNAKVVKIYTQNKSTQKVYIKLNLNAGYSWNELKLLNQIGTNGYNIGSNIDIEAYVNGVKVTEMPTGCAYTASVRVFNGTSEISSDNTYMTCNYLNEKWSLNLQEVTEIPTKIRIDFTDAEIPADAYITNFVYKDPTTDEPFPYYTYRIYKTGYYKLETWGAQGHHGGRGGYSDGIAKLTAGQLLYIYVGGAAINQTGGYNGGGSNTGTGATAYGGGGATHIATKIGVLKNLKDNVDSIIMVAGGGAGHYNTNSVSVGDGSGGGYIGAPSRLAKSSGGQSQAKGGTQTAGGSSGAGFGYGANRGAHGAGGGGFYGGGIGGTQGSSDYGGGGGSGYINSTYLLSGKRFMYCFNCSESTTDGIYTVKTNGTSTLRDTVNCSTGYSADPISKCAKVGNGHARITYLKDYVE